MQPDLVGIGFRHVFLGASESFEFCLGHCAFSIAAYHTASKFPPPHISEHQPAPAWAQGRA